MDFLVNSQIQLFLQLILATLLGAFIGFEREYKRKEAGLQTYSLVCLGACLFTVLSNCLFFTFLGQKEINFDPSRIIQAIVMGVGFIGAGVIFREKITIKGLTAAAGLWVTAAIGIAVGIGYYSLAAFSAILVILILFGFGELERNILNKIWDRKT